MIRLDTEEKKRLYRKHLYTCSCHAVHNSASIGESIEFLSSYAGDLPTTIPGKKLLMLIKNESIREE